jgi:3D (Asp-Asp-Asp) domain-containing protein
VHDIATRLLVIAQPHDPDHPVEIAHRIGSAFPQATVVVLPQPGAVITMPQEVARRIAGFLQTGGGPGEGCVNRRPGLTELCSPSGIPTKRQFEMIYRRNTPDVPRRMQRRAPGRTRRLLLPVGLAGAVLLGGCEIGGTPAVPAPPTGTGAAAAHSPTSTTAAAPTTGSASGRGVPLGVFEVTCHTGQGVTASGGPPTREVVSVDRRLLPFGTRLVIDQVGLRIASDTGPAMVGRRLDIWEPTEAACTKFGRKRLQVWRQP